MGTVSSGPPLSESTVSKKVHMNVSGVCLKSIVSDVSYTVCRRGADSNTSVMYCGPVSSKDAVRLGNLIWTDD